MYREEPWTLNAEKVKEVKKRSKNALTLVENYLKRNKSRVFSMADIMRGVDRCKASVSTALAQLKESGKVKIVGTKGTVGSLIVFYQHISGSKKAIPVIELGKEKGRGFITFKTFIKENGVVNETKFRYSIEEEGVPSYLVKTSSSYAYAYKEKDLKKLLTSHRKIKKVKRQFKMFNWIITIEQD